MSFGSNKSEKKETESSFFSKLLRLIIFTCGAKIRISPTANKPMKAYIFFIKKAVKQNAAPSKVDAASNCIRSIKR